MTGPYRLRPISPRILVEKRDGHWAVWFEHRPEAVFGGRTAAEAVVRLSGPEELDEDEAADKPESWRDRPTLL